MAAGTQWGCGAALLNGPLTLWNMLVEALSKVADARDVHPREVVWQGRSIDVLVREWADGVEVGAFVETMLDLLLGSPYLRAAVAAAAGGSGGGAEYSDKNAEGQEDAHVCCCGAAVTADAGNYIYELVRGGWHRSMHAACSFVAHADAAAAAGPTRSS
eukprot:COSAG01_NODE_4945_length_4602_cov_5.799023_3_plen_159_part_00